MSKTVEGCGGILLINSTLAKYKTLLFKATRIFTRRFASIRRCFAHCGLHTNAGIKPLIAVYSLAEVRQFPAKLPLAICSFPTNVPREGLRALADLGVNKWTRLPCFANPEGA